VAPCGLRGRKSSAPFPGRMSYKETKPGLVSVLYLSMRYTVLLFIRAPFYVFVAMCSVFWLFWLSYQYLSVDWLERLLWGSLIVVRDRLQKAQAEECAWISWLYCFIVLLCICVVSCPYVTYFPTVMARYSLFVLKVLLNPKQASKQTNIFIGWPLGIHPDLEWSLENCCLNKNQR